MLKAYTKISKNSKISLEHDQIRFSVTDTLHLTLEEALKDNTLNFKKHRILQFMFTEEKELLEAIKCSFEGGEMKLFTISPISIITKDEVV
jgi:hypothetical protein